MGAIHIIKRDGAEFEQFVMCELLIPDIPNVYGDISTKETIREAAFQFAAQGYGLDVNHDQVNVNGEKLVVVESFIARPGDPDFIEGSWVVGMKILDDALWQQVLSGELNGFSYEAEVYMTPVIIQNLRNRQVSGTTEPDPIDGHAHTYLVLLDSLNRPISGGTGVTDGHSHRIVSHTVTELAVDQNGNEHSHRFQVLVDEDQGDDDVAGT